jgi:uncharacterized protein YcnI/predicted anti-sigma-YlaC factor YlaD
MAGNYPLPYGDLKGMDCNTSRQAVCASTTDRSPQSLVHLRTCPLCQEWLRGIAELNADSAAQAERPSVSEQIVAARVQARAGRLRTAPALLVRGALVVVGLTQLAWSLLDLLTTHSSTEMHEGHELTSLGVALGVGLMVGGLQPRRADGMVPLIGAAAALLTITGLDDWLHHRTHPGHEAVHLLTVIGFALLLIVGQIYRGGRPATAAGRGWQRVRASKSPMTSLRLVRMVRVFSARDARLAWMRRLVAAPVALVVLVVAVIAVATPAFAHVTVSSTNARVGGYAKLTFNVPNERDTARTTKVEVAFPTDHPFASVSVEPVPGWTSQVRTAKLAEPIESEDGDITEAVSRITWTATSGGLSAGQFQEFHISAGPMPDVTSLTFKALQTYSNGEIVRWIQVAEPGQPEPDNPAPVLNVTPAAAGSDGGATPPAQTDTAASSPDDGSSSGTSGVAIAALVLAVLALIVSLVGAVGLRRTRNVGRSSSP